jgi:predicted SprT family Zn-dependent metalloprotease
MCHLWQAHYGKPSRAAHHNKEWARKMEEIGLTPSATGQQGGKQTGPQMTHYITPGGLFEREIGALLAGGFTLRWQSGGRSSSGKGVNKNKAKYTCPDCGQNAWAKPGARLVCGDCMQPMQANQ